MWSTLNRVTRMSALRLALSLSAVFLVLLFLGGIGAQWWIERELRRGVDLQLFGDHAALSLEPVNALEDWLASEQEEQFPMAFFSLQDGDGGVLGPARSALFAQSGFLTLRTAELFEPGDRRLLRADPEAADRWRVYVAPTRGGVLAVFTPLSDLEQALDIVPLTMLATGGALTLVTLAGGVAMGLRTQRRLARLLRGLDGMARGALDPKLAPARPRDDLDLIAQGVDRAGAQLSESMRALRDFSHNVAHELRTPLARLQARLDGARTPEDIEAAQDEADGLLRSFDALRRIARMQAGGGAEALRPVDLGALAQEAADLLRPAIEEEGGALELVLDAPETRPGDRQVLLQALSNLIDNARRHAGPGAQIVLTARGAALSVEDDGPGVPEEERARVLQPFYRSDASRASPGTGLGLPLAAAAARMHGGELTLGEAGAGGLRVEMALV